MRRVREILPLKREGGVTDRAISRTISEPRGFMKALVEADGDRILGFIMVRAEAGEAMSVVQTAMLAGMPYTGLRDAIITHPKMAEGLVALFSNVPAR
jgi:pyruvate/2-oxoglutarate dehydrogenase complex dihydrolipoamide dehydrogenase (E3) component